MRLFTLKVFANNEYALRERLQEIDRAISNTVWPCCYGSTPSRARTERGCIEEEKQYQLSDYEYEKEDPTWRFSGNDAVVGKWKMQIVPDEEYVTFQESPDL